MKSIFENIIFRSILLFFITFIPCRELYAGDTVRDMILEESGVSENDISSALSKKAVSLYDAFALSVRFTENLPIAGENVIQAESLYSQAIGSCLPKISINAERPLTKNNSDTGSLPGKTSAYIYGRQPVVTGLNEWTDIHKSKRAVSISRHFLKLSVQQQLLIVAQKYYLVCQLNSTLDTDREIVELYKKIRVEQVRRVAVGKNRQNDVMRTDAQISRLEAQVALVSSQLAIAENDFALTAGIPSTVMVTGGIELPPPVYKPEDLHSIIFRRTEVIIAKEKVEVANMDLKAAWGGHLPTVYLEGNYRLYKEGINSGDKYNVAVAASLPIFQGGITSEKIYQSESVKRQAELVFTQTTRAVEEDIKTSYDAWCGFVKQSDAYKKALESAERNYRYTINDYRLSLVTVLDVISVLTDLQQARNDFKTAMYASQLSRIRLGVAINEFPEKGNSVLKNTASEKIEKL